MPFLGNIGSTEIFIIVLVLFFLFGGKKLHEWARGIGEAGNEVKKVKKEFEEGFEGKIENEEENKKSHNKNKKKKEVE